MLATRATFTGSALSAIVAVLTALFAAATLAPAARAQRPVTSIVRVRVSDSTGVAIPGAEVSVVQGLNSLLAVGTTDATGLRVFTLSGVTGDVELIVRRIGYRRADRFFTLAGDDTASFGIALWRVVQTLKPVKVSAREDARRKAYYIDADAIAKSDRPLFSALDIVGKLRPDMTDGRGCGGIANVWVNGRRIFMVQIDEMARARQHSGLTAKLKLEVQSILASIRPEHVAEMTFNDCFERSIKINHGANAVFVVLKPGVGFEPGLGSYVAEDTTPSAAPAKRKPGS
jgi:hypothetical protein